MSNAIPTLHQDDAEWRRVRKFPEYEINEQKQVRHIRWKRIIPVVHVGDADYRERVMLTKGSFAQPAWLNEIYIDAYPEKRSLVTSN